MGRGSRKFSLCQVPCWAHREDINWPSSAHGELSLGEEATGKHTAIGQDGRYGASTRGFLCATFSLRLSPDLADSGNRRQGDLILGSEKGVRAWRQEDGNSSRPQRSLGLEAQEENAPTRPSQLRRPRTACVYRLHPWPLQGPYNLQLPHPHRTIRGQALGGFESHTAFRRHDSRAPPQSQPWLRAQLPLMAEERLRE